MRRTVIGLAMAGVLVLGACGGDDDGGGDAAEEEAGGGNEGQEGGGGPRDTSPEAQAFCEGFAGLAQQGASGSPADPTAIVSELSALEPPAEIAEDFAVAVEAAEAQAQAMGGSADPEAAQQFQENAERYTEANANVTAYVTENCDFNMPGAETGTGGGAEAPTETTAAPEGGG